MNDPCPVCKKPRDKWPMAHRGDPTCSPFCEKKHEAEPGPDTKENDR